MANEILNDNDYEGLKLFDVESETSQVTSEYLKKVVGNLFKDTSVNTDDFHYMIFNENYPNAFFISSNNTNDNKNILAVSRGLIDACQNEAELAGIIGHECGHYLWDQLLGGKNTIFQEHLADLRAVDLLMNAGFKDEDNKEYKYNPRHHLAVCERIFSDYGRNSFSEISLGVHGNSLARIEDIKDYMTKIANEQGDFPPISEEEDKAYKSFQAKVKSAYEKEGYDTYLDKCFKKKYGTKDITKISIENVMKTMIEEISANRITPKQKVRFYQVRNIIKEYYEKGMYDSKSEQLTELCKNFFEVTRDNIERNAPYERNENPESSLKEMLSGFKLNVYGDFAKQMENVSHFVNYKNQDDAVYWAKEMYKLSWTLPYAQCFRNAKYDSLTAKREDNIGKPLPWDELQGFIKDGNLAEDEKRALSWATDTVYNPDSWGLSKIYSYHSYNINKEDEEREKERKHSEFYYVENGVVVAFGHEAIKRHYMDRYNSETQKFLYECKNTYERFDRNITIYNELATFVDENATKEDIAESKQKLKEYFSEHKDNIRFDEDCLVYFSSYHAGSNPANVKNPYVEEIVERYNASKMKRVFVSSEDAPIRAIYARERSKEQEEKIKRVKERENDTDSKAEIINIDDEYKIQKISDATNIKQNSGVHKKTVLSLIRFAEEIYNEDPKLSCKIFEIASEKIAKNFDKKRDKELGYVSRDGNIYDEQKRVVATKKGDSQLVDEHGEVIGYLKGNTGYLYNDTFIQRDWELNRDDLKHIYNRVIVKYPLMLKKMLDRGSYDQGEETPLDKTVLPEISQENLKKSPFLEKAMHTAGFNPHATLMENLTKLDEEFGKQYFVDEYSARYRGNINVKKEVEQSIFDLDKREFRSINSLGENPDNLRKKEFLEQAGILMLANSIKKGEDYDLKTVMRYLQFSQGSSVYSPKITDMLAEDIEKK